MCRVRVHAHTETQAHYAPMHAHTETQARAQREPLTTADQLYHVC